jgi:hypothetical protein
MDPKLLYKRFKTLVEFGMALKRDPNGPLITHSIRGDMDIWQILAFEFHADIQQVKDVLLPQIKHDATNTSYVWLKNVPMKHLETKNVSVSKMETPDGEWSVYDSWREGHHGKSSHPRLAAVCEFARMGGLLWRASVLVMAAERMGEFLESTDEFLTLGSIRIIRQTREDKTTWIGHEPQKLTRHYLQWPRQHRGHRDTAKLDITGLEQYFVEQVIQAANENYRAVYGVFLNNLDPESERHSVERDFDQVLTRGDLTYPGEPHA